MKWMKKYAYCLILTLFLVSFLFFGGSGTDEEALGFYVGNNGKTERVEIYTSEDRMNYVFLPSYAEMEQVTVSFPESQEFFLGGIEIEPGADCGIFSLNQKYAFQIGENTGMIQFCRSANVPTLYIETSSGSMESIYANKEYEEVAAVTLYSPAGDIECADRNCFLKGRGNSTWEQPKKPFLLRLSREAGLLGMGEDTDWVLLANALDESNLHNKLILDMADRVCETWTPRCEYVDVYLNGQYNGLYLLAEKIGSGPNRLNLNKGAGDFLCTVDFSSRTEILENPFYTENGRTIAICEPNILSKENKERIEELVNQQERILMSQEDLTQVTLVDIDSWARKYLVDEIAGNTDADLSSSYFYYSDGVFYGGPAWDYDMAFGNTIQNHYAKAFIAKNYRKYSYYRSVYYSALFCNESFAKRLQEIYEKDFLPVLIQMADHDVQYTADQIALAVNMNRIRWPIEVKEHPEYGPWDRYVNTEETIIQYIRGRIELLSSAFLDVVPYCTVQFEHENRSYFWTVSVPCGSVLANTDVVNEPLYAEVDSVVWHIEGTDEIFDLDQPICEDLVLRRHKTIS